MKKEEREKLSTALDANSPPASTGVFTLVPSSADALLVWLWLTLLKL